MSTITADVETALWRQRKISSRLRDAVGSLSSLSTSEKDSLVDAINELLTLAQVIDDSQTATDRAWSSQKTSQAIAAAVAALSGSVAGALEQLSQRIDGLELDLEQALAPSWLQLREQWDTPPEDIGAATAPVAGRVWRHVWLGTTRYRLIPTVASAYNDAFYSAHAAGTCSGVIARQGAQP